MKINPVRFLTLAAALAANVAAGSALAASPAALENWPQWRGPLGTGVAPNANPPLEWSETKNVKWKTEIPGAGASTPIVWGDQVFIQTAIATGKKSEEAAAPEPEPAERPGRRRRGRGRKPTEFHQFVLLSVDRGTGEIRWQKTVREEVPHEGHHQDHGFSSSSPVTDGRHIAAYFGSRGLHGFDMEGNLKWSRDLGRMQTKMSFGEGSSPALHDGVVVVNWDHEGDDFIAAFDLATGRELWRQPRDEDTSWSTPLIVEHEGRAQVITSATGAVRAYDLKTGEPIWKGPGLTSNAIPTPVSAGGVVYVTSGFRGNALYAINLDATGDISESGAILWSHDKSTPYVPSPLLYGNRLYFLSHNNNILSCFDAKTGEPLIDAERIPGMRNIYASPAGADGRVYLLGRGGVSVVIKDSDKLEILATNKLDDGFEASPAIVGNEIFLRGRKYLYCLAEN